MSDSVHKSISAGVVRRSGQNKAGGDTFSFAQGGRGVRLARSFKPTRATGEEMDRAIAAAHEANEMPTARGATAYLKRYVDHAPFVSQRIKWYAERPHLEMPGRANAAKPKNDKHPEFDGPKYKSPYSSQHTSNQTVKADKIKPDPPRRDYVAAYQRRRAMSDIDERSQRP